MPWPCKLPPCCLRIYHRPFPHLRRPPAGTLLVGSSREFGGFDSEGDPHVVDAIMRRAMCFLPGGLGAPPQGVPGSFQHWMNCTLRVYAPTGVPGHFLSFALLGGSAHAAGLQGQGDAAMRARARPLLLAAWQREGRCLRLLRAQARLSHARRAACLQGWRV